LFIEEFVHLVISARSFTLLSLWRCSLPILRSDHFVVRVLGFDVLSIVMALIIATGLWASPVP
jgi:branched-chain amino acid transport system permease protein